MATERPAIIVRKLRPDGSEAYRWPARLLEQDAQGVVVVARFNGPPGSRIADVPLEQDDVFVEFYYFDRWFNVFQVYSSTGQLKGWYCNVSTPAELRDGWLVHTDLVLDVYLRPTGEPEILDQDEYQRWVGQLEPAVAAGAERGLAAVLELVRQRALPSRPFDQSVAALCRASSP